MGSGTDVIKEGLSLWRFKKQHLKAKAKEPHDKLTLPSRAPSRGCLSLAPASSPHCPVMSL